MRPIAMLLMAIALLGSVPDHAEAQLLLYVDSPVDAVDANPGDGVCSTTAGQCTVRAAVQEANAFPGLDGVGIPAGTYVLGVPGRAEDAAVTGDLDITDHLSIVGLAGASSTILDGAGLDRLVDIAPGIGALIRGLTIRNGLTLAGEDGGGIRVGATCNVGVIPSLQLQLSVVRGNHAGRNGGGVAFVCAAGSQIFESSLTDNVADGVAVGPSGGGGVFAFLTFLTVERSTLARNAAPDGGGVLSRTGSSVWVTATTISDNRAINGRGGGVVFGSFEAALHMTNATVSGNTATTDGGGIALAQWPGESLDATAELNNVTIANNAADIDANGSGDGGGLFSLFADAVTLRNTIVADNFDGGGEAPDCAGQRMLSQGYDLISSLSGCTLGGDTTGNVTGVSAVLGPLADNGGPTETHLPLPASPALEGGSPATPGSGGTACAVDDQRGTPRPQGPRCDIGAVEPTETACDPMACVDDFLCYQVRESAGSSRFSGLVATLSDEFETLDFEVSRPKNLCTPADRDGGGTSDPAIHLEAYSIRTASGVSVRRTGIVLTNDLGAVTLDTVKPYLLLVPTAKALTLPPPPPDPAVHQVDSYKCYRAKVTRGSTPFVEGQVVTLQDQFTSPPKPFVIKKPRLLCTPVSVDGEPVKHPDGYLVCFQARPAAGAPRHVTRSGIHVSNAFGAGRLDTVKDRLVCLVSTR